MFTLVVLRLVLVTRELDVSRMRLLHEATHDSLTGLANRTVFADRVDAARARRQPDGSHAAVLSIDLDDFKSVNDSLGHAAGDRLLRVIADRLTALLRPGDIVARLGGDEFAILLESVQATDVASAVARRAIDTISQSADVGAETADLPERLGRHRVRRPLRRRRRGDARRRRRDVPRQASRQGPLRGVRDRHASADARASGASVELVDALDRGELAVRYQPVVAIENNRVHGFEALLRWNHPTRGEVEPAQFISIAEAAELLAPIGRWVLEEACRQAQAWDPSPNGPEISVNVSPMQLASASFVADVRRALDRSRLGPAPAAARDHRLDAGRPPRRRRRCPPRRSATSACASPSTTSVSGTPRSTSCACCRSTS